MWATEDAVERNKRALSGTGEEKTAHHARPPSSAVLRCWSGGGRGSASTHARNLSVGSVNFSRRSMGGPTASNTQPDPGRDGAGTFQHRSSLRSHMHNKTCRSTLRCGHGHVAYGGIVHATPSPTARTARKCGLVMPEVAAGSSTQSAPLIATMPHAGTGNGLLSETAVVGPGRARMVDILWCGMAQFRLGFLAPTPQKPSSPTSLIPEQAMTYNSSRHQCNGKHS